ncbi:MAG: hypothetical protein JWR50_3123 [Mucilaginibacter sp.]|nr:hypothetical protein [Mucilaginibacter sp.]
MVNKLTFCLAIFCSVFFPACRKPIKTKLDLIQYINDENNGLIKSQVIKGVTIRLTYKPWQLLAANAGAINAVTLNQIKQKAYFTLGLSKDKKELLRQLPFDQYSEILQTLAFKMRPNINIRKNNKNVIEVEDCLFQQTYGMGRENNLLLIFEDSKLKDADQLIVSIKEFGLGLGDLKFQFNRSDINDLSGIKL